MARENQGLQIALIILFMLTIILGVTTYIFCSQYIEADDKARKLAGELSGATTALQTTQDENNQLKKMILGTEDAAEKELDEITTQFNEDKEKFAAGYDNVAKFYRPLLEHLYGLVDKKTAELTDANGEIAKAQAGYDAWRAEQLALVKNHDDSRLATEKKLTETDALFSAGIAQIKGEKDKLKGVWEAAREAAETRLASLQQEKADAETETKKQRGLADQWKSESEDLKKETFEVADGTVTWVDQRGGMVWIDLGRGDSLRRQTTFSVYPIDTSNLAKAGKKASIEVTRVRGEHLAEARIVEDSASDPIMVGDKIHTPIWSVGQQRRFVLVGFMDLDKDGENDLDMMADLIRMSGGRVDCSIDEKGGVFDAKGDKVDAANQAITIDTRYMVLGEPEDSEDLPASANNYSDVITGGVDVAKQYGMQQLAYRDLLKQMGWIDQNPVVRYGRDANMKDFQPTTPRGVPRVSTGSVTDLFQPRRPPTGQVSPRGGAY